MWSGKPEWRFTKQEEPGRGVAEMSGVKARVRVDFRYHSLMGTMEEFRDLWCFTSAVCTVQEGKLSLFS